MHRRRREHRILRRVQNLDVQSERSVEAAQVRCLVEEDAADRNLLAEIDHDPVIVACRRVEVPASRTRTTGRGGGAADVPVNQSRQRSAKADAAGRHGLPRRHVTIHVPGRVNDHLAEVKIVVDDEFDVTTDWSGRFVLLRQPSARREIGEMFSTSKLSLERRCRRLHARTRLGCEARRDGGHCQERQD